MTTGDQAETETDRLWAAAGRCGWLIDRFEVSWRLVPRALPSLVGGHDREAAARASEAMMGMTKVDVAALAAACGGG